LFAIGGEGAVPSQPPEVIGLVIALPILVRLLLSISAGVVEELFFRGFLQPRVGVLASSTLFVMAHLSYDQPFLLIGVGLLSLLFASLVIWRQSIWAAISAHAVFDAIQLLIVIPAAMRFLEQAEPGPVAWTLSWILSIG
jgi:membrane protease YdiL (CAAX protease family)